MFVSSRSEREVADAWIERTPKVPIEDTDLIDAQTTLDDITTYIIESVRKIPARGSKRWPPTDGEARECAIYCGGIFEIAKIRMRILEDSRGVPMEEAFQTLIADTRRGIPTYTSEYMRILRKAYFVPYAPTGVVAEDKERARMKETVLQRFRAVIGAVLYLRQPLSLGSLSRLLKMNQTETLSVLRPISSIFSIPEYFFEPPHFFHATCVEFLTGDPSGFEEDQIFFFDDPKGAFLAPICLDILNASLRPGALISASVIFNLFSVGIFYICALSSELLYSIRFWVDHLDPTRREVFITTMDKVRPFVSRHWVAWMEAMALEGALARSSDEHIVPEDDLTTALGVCNRLKEISKVCLSILSYPIGWMSDIV